MTEKPPGRIVYTTGIGRCCPECGRAQTDCRCRSQAATRPTPNDGWVRISRETKGRRGKGVTLIQGLPFEEEDLTRLLKSLKQLCGSGGTLKAGVIEIQGDHRETLRKQLVSQGLKVKLQGG